MKERGRPIELRGNNLAAFVDHTSRVLLLDGPAGTGKTISHLLKLLWFCGTFPGARCAIVRQTRHSLTETALVTWEQRILGPKSPVLARPCERSHRQAYKFLNGSRVVVGGMDKPDAFLSSEWDLVYVNEATELNKAAWETIIGRLRAGNGPFHQLLADCNPGAPSHWLKQRCDQGLCRRLSTFHYDNPAYYDDKTGQWTRAGNNYVGGILNQLTGHRRRRFKDGDWVAAEGIIYAGFIAEDAPTGHLLPNDWRAPASWKRVWGLDWGDRSPTVLLDFAVDPDSRMYLDHEWYMTELRAYSLGKHAAEYLLAGGVAPTAAVCDHDPEMKAEFERGAKEAGWPIVLQMADKRDKKRGIQAMQGRFDFAAVDRRPRIFIRRKGLMHPPDPKLVDSGHPTCMLDELTTYKYDKRFMNDEPEDQNDHACDAARYVQNHVDGGLGGSEVYDADRDSPPPGDFRGYYDS